MTPSHAEPTSRRTFLGQAAGLSVGLMSGLPRSAAAADPKAATDTAKPAVRTVLGPVAPAKLGLTLTHEHAPLVDWSELYEAPAAPVVPVRSEMLAASVKLLTAFHKSLAAGDGPGAIVECTPIRAGRYPQLLVDLAKSLPVHIIGCTGFWCEAMAPQHPWAVQLSVQADGVKQMAALFIREIEEGMEDPTGKWGEKFTKIKAGIIKCATSKYMRPSERRCHEASAIASLETGCPITTHTTDGGGLEQAQFLLKQGVKPEKLIIGHQGNQDDRTHDDAHEYHRQLVALGCYVQFDRVGHEKYSAEKTASQIKRLVDAGFKKQVLLSHDHVPYFFTDYTSSKKQADGWLVKESDYTIVPTALAAACQEVGISKADSRVMMVENPQRVLAF